MESLKYDKRIAERNIQHGLLTREEYQSYIAKLKDLSGECETVNIALYKEDEILASVISDQDEPEE